MTRRRLDAELVRRGLVADRAEAERAVLSGLVTIGGAPASKPATLVATEVALSVRRGDRRFVSRGGEKLAAALERSRVDPQGLDCLDAGASTGGFTDCLLKAGAARVIAVDVGYGQLAWGLRSDPRVIVLERTHVRDLDPTTLPFAPSLVVADLSFISLSLAIPALSTVASEAATFILLVKPQFEASAAEVQAGGVVRDTEVWRSTIERVAGSCERSGLGVLAVGASPILGPAGNVEFWLHAVSGSASRRFGLDAAIDEARESGP